MPLTPPTNQIENPDPMAGTNNWYTQDGYSGGTYSNCADFEPEGRRRRSTPIFQALGRELRTAKPATITF